ncbi:MAG: hypothetical protein OXU19_19600, partial [bacterium]|nr:hypothetical protein [bacterium]
ALPGAQHLASGRAGGTYLAGIANLEPPEVHGFRDPAVGESRATAAANRSSALSGRRYWLGMLFASVCCGIARKRLHGGGGTPI